MSSEGVAVMDLLIWGIYTVFAIMVFVWIYRLWVWWRETGRLQ